MLTAHAVFGGVGLTRVKDLLPAGWGSRPEPSRVRLYFRRLEVGDHTATVAFEARDPVNVISCWSAKLDTRVGTPIEVATPIGCDYRTEDGAGNSFWITSDQYSREFHIHVEPGDSETPGTILGPLRSLRLLGLIPGTLIASWIMPCRSVASLHFVSLLTGDVYAELPIHASHMAIDQDHLWVLGREWRTGDDDPGGCTAKWEDLSAEKLFVIDRRSSAPVRRIPLVDRALSNLVLTDRGTAVLAAGRDSRDPNGRLIEVGPHGALVRQCELPFPTSHSFHCCVPSVSQILVRAGWLYVLGHVAYDAPWIGAFQVPGLRAADEGR
jgi:hypothetical protein